MIIIIIGLPGSGKTTYYNNHLKNDYKLYDDFINNFYDGELINDIINNINICIIDPRLCNINTFNFFLKNFEEYIDRKQIQLILFQNNKDKCLNNVKLRNTINCISTIKYLSSIYFIDNYIKIFNIIEIVDIYDLSFEDLKISSFL